MMMNDSPIAHVDLQTPIPITNNNIWYDTRLPFVKITNKNNLTHVTGTPIFTYFLATFDWRKWEDPVRLDKFDEAVRAF